MDKQGKRIILAVLAALLISTVSVAQTTEPADSLVRLLKASSVKLMKVDENNYRKVFDATFLHNGTYLICDSAIWDETGKIINAYGNVQLIQEETILTSEMLDYLIDENLAQFRGPMVQLKDKDNNVLRTNFLDYNTRDSLAIYSRGASLKDKDGKVIESINGSYRTSDKIFHFNDNVNMFSDSVFIRTEKMDYDTQRDLVIFDEPIDFWKDEYMLSSLKGEYDKKAEVFFLYDNVHGTSNNQEVWGDSLYHRRFLNETEVFGNVQFRDTVHNVSALGDRMLYEGMTSKGTLTGNAAVRMISSGEQEREDTVVTVTDTLYLRADKFEYWTQKHNEVDSSFVAQCTARLNDMTGDPIASYRKKVAEAAKQKAEKAKREKEEKNGKRAVQQAKDQPQPVKPAPKEEKPPIDTLPKPVDSSEVAFLKAYYNVRMFRKDIQMACDSVFYCGLDSIARIFGNPRIWNDGNRQYVADSIDLLIKDSRPFKADLITGAFISVEEVPGQRYDQIKAAEIVAYFDTTSTLSRFDALGGVTACFYIKEKETFSTLNKVSCTLLSAEFENGDVSNITYFDKPKNNAFPVAQLKESDKYLTGFTYNVADRPSCKEDITEKEFRNSQRSMYKLHATNNFSSTERYFDRYISKIRREISERKRAAALRTRAKKLELEEEGAIIREGSEEESAAKDSLAVKDSLSIQKLALSDSLAVSDTTVVSDTTAAVKAIPTKADLRRAEAEKRRLKREAEEAARLEKQNAKWAKKKAAADKKAEEKALKKAIIKAKRDAKAALDAEKQAERDSMIVERFKERYRKQLLRKKADQVQDNL